MSIRSRRVIRIGNNVRILWRGKEFRKAVLRDADNVAMKSARLVAAVAGGLVQGRAKHPTRHLASEIVAMRSRFEGGGAVAWAQAPGRYTGKYHASFVELGTSRRVRRRELYRGPLRRLRRRKTVTATNQKPMRYMRDAADMLAPPTFERFKRAFIKNVNRINRDYSADDISF